MKHFIRSLVGVCGMVAGLAGLDLPAQPTPPVVPPVQVLNPPVLPPPAASLENLIAWDAERKDSAVPAGTAQAQYTFNLTNISHEVITINSVATSCGCTVARLPEQPWHIPPGSNGQISATMNLAGKSGTVVKTLTVNSDKGNKLLYVQVTILPPSATPAPMTEMDREQNQKLAIADRQSVFKGECASCHAAPAVGKSGQQLYTAVCGVCHEAEHRATMVANLHALPYETSAEIWRLWITHGKPGSLMPAFALSEGGILTDEQITSLVNYLVVAIPARPAGQLPKTTTAH